VAVLYTEFVYYVSEFSEFPLLVLYISKLNLMSLRVYHLSVFFVSLYQLLLCACRLCGYFQFFLSAINSLCFCFSVLCDLPVSDLMLYCQSFKPPFH
jgi:hypothetical protein